MASYTATTVTQLSSRDRSVLRAVEAGRATAEGRRCTSLLIDGLRCADQFVGPRLAEAGLIVLAGPDSSLALLTPSGQAALRAA